MRIFWFLMMISAFLYAKPVESFLASFTQTLTSEQNDSVSYGGEVYFQKDRALWHYKNPSEKMIYIHPDTVVVVEPPLEQAIYSTHNEMLKMQSLLNEWIDSGQKEIEYDGIIYKITFQDGLPQRIDYLDSLDNKVVITLNDIQTNAPLAKEQFEPKIPQNFDILNY